MILFSVIWMINITMTSESKLNDVLNSFPITVKPAHVFTSIKQSPVLKGHFFHVL